MSQRRRTATVLFVDIVESTRIAAELGDARFRELIARFNRIVRTALRSWGGREEDRAGDGFFATFAEPTQAIRCASAIAERVRDLGVEVRSGIHTGETEQIEGKRQGIAVVIGARVMSLASAGEVLVTSTTKELAAGSRFTFEDLSAHELKGVPGTWQVWAVTGVDGTPRPAPLPASEAADRLRAIHEPVEPHTKFRRSIVIRTAVVAIAALTVAAILLLLGRDGERPSRRDEIDVLNAGTLAQVDPTGEIVSRIHVEPLQLARTNRHTTRPLVVGQGGVWLVRRDQIIHVDPEDLDEAGRPRLESGNPVSINVASGSDAIWVMTDGTLFRVHPTTDEVRAIETIRRGPILSWTTDVAAGAGFVWIGTSDGELVRVDPNTGDAERAEGLDPIDAIEVGPNAVWTSDALGGAITRYDVETLEPVEVIEVPGGVDGMALSGADVWVLSRSVGQVTRIVDGTPRSPIRVGDDPTSIAVGLGAVWVGDEDGVIRRIDLETNLTEQVPFGAPIRTIAVDEEHETLWIDVA